MDELNDKKIFVTSALPYANGSIHIGHLVEYIQTDVFVKFLKVLGKDVVYCCADDSHGTPIEFNATKQGITPKELVDKVYKEHVKDFSDFHIEFDNFYTTDSEENRKLSEFFFEKAKDKGYIYTKEIELTYCEHCKRFLPDRFVKGKCPKCGAEDQYGDVCEKCNATYETTDLVDPYCTICKNTPTRKKSNHYFFKLSEFSGKLKDWLNSNDKLQKEVKNFVLHWIDEGLKDWCISRDGPYFGFKIPGEEDKYFYVWLDAPIGYMSSLQNYLDNNNPERTIGEYWQDDSGYVIHFIGKDIIYFHFLFWPALLMAADFNLPNNLRVHGFLTVNKEKMSKSRGTFVTARKYLEKLEPEYMRYYYTANQTSRLDDIDLDIADFKDKINNELISNVINLIYRTFSFANKNLDSELSTIPEDAKELLQQVSDGTEKVKDLMLKYEFREAIKETLHLSTLANKYFQDNAPWKLMKEDKERARQVITACANVVKDLCIVLYPVLPETISKVYSVIGMQKPVWDDRDRKLENMTVQRIEPLMRRIDKELEEVFASKEKEEKKAEEKKPDFSAVHLKVAEIKEAKPHPDADKLMVLQLSLGDEERQIVAGIREYFKPEELVGKKIVVVSNLEPAKLRGEVSNGMLLAASEGEKLTLVDPGDARPGETVSAEGFAPNDKKINISVFSKIRLSVKDETVFYKETPLMTSAGQVSAKGMTEKASIR